MTGGCSFAASLPPSRRARLVAPTYVFPYAFAMKTISASAARSNLYKLLDETADSHEPVQITGKRKNAVLISEEDWRAVQETLYLLSMPGMRTSVRRGMKTPLAKLSKEPGW